jgi:hypothetical protein
LIHQIFVFNQSFELPTRSRFQVYRASGYVIGRRIGSEFFTNIICSGSGQFRLNCRRRPSLAAISKHLNESLAHARLPRKFCSRYELKDLSHIASPRILTRALNAKQFHRRIKAYEDMRFLESKDARALRILAEYLEPLSRFQRNEVRDTIVFMGSARLVSHQMAEAALAEAEQMGSGVAAAHRPRALDLLRASA